MAAWWGSEHAARTHSAPELRECVLGKLTQPMPGGGPTAQELVELIERRKLIAAAVGKPKSGRRRAPLTEHHRLIRAMAIALSYEGKHDKRGKALPPNVEAAKDRRLIAEGYDTESKVRDLKRGGVRRGWLTSPGRGRRGGHTFTTEGQSLLEEAEK